MAKSDIGTITIRLRAEAQQFDASMKKGAQSVGNFQAKVQESTDKMRVAWTSLQSKIGLVTGGIEGAFKLGSAAIRIFKGDADGAVEALKTLPFGIGPVVSAMEGFYNDISGYTTLLEEQTAAIAKLKKEAKALADQVKRNKDAMKDAFSYADASRGSDTRADSMKAESRGQTIEFNLAAEIEANTREYNKATAALAKQMTPKAIGFGMFESAELSKKGGKKALDEALRSSEMKNEKAREYARLLQKAKDLQEWQARYQKDLSAYQQAATSAQSDINKTAKHELQLLAKQGASDEDILKRRLKLHEDIGRELKKQNTGLLAGGADDAVLAASRLAMQEHKTQGVRSLETSLAEQMKKKDDLGMQGQQSISSSFSTAVGSIVIPDARATQGARQAQLTELQKINAGIVNLNSMLTLARNQNP